MPSPPSTDPRLRPHAPQELNRRSNVAAAAFSIKLEPTMSRGLPSMTALLGLLAIAGYQNRDKLAELIKGASGGSPQPSPGNAQGPSHQGSLPHGSLPQGSSEQGGLGGLLGNLGGTLGSGGVGGLLGGGLGELLERFKQNGQGEVAQSWIDSGPNKELPAPQLKQAIGADVLAALQQQTGLSQDELLARLSRELPAAVDKYTPDGRLPS
jgi:uncharacterized protein YidB (DUF937 family)